MHIERFFVPGLAHASYVVVAGREAVVVDPERNVEGYLDYLAKNGLELRYIFLTHPHADFVAGHAELSARSGAPILISESAPATFPHRDLEDGDRIALGSVEIEVIATPGHSPDSICLCVFKSGALVALFSVGRWPNTKKTGGEGDRASIRSKPRAWSCSMACFVVQG